MKILKRLLLISTASILALVIYISIFPLEPLANIALSFLFKFYGFYHADAKITYLGKNRIEIERMHLGDPENLYIKSAKINYNLGNKFKYVVNSLEIDNIKLLGQKNINNELSFGYLDSLLKQIGNSSDNDNEQKASDYIQIKNINITDSFIEIKSTNQDLELPFTLTYGDNDTLIALKVIITSGNLRLNNFDMFSAGNVELRTYFDAELPFERQEKQIFLKNGIIKSTEKGYISYKPYYKVSNEQLNTLLSALYDYNYRDYEIKLSHDTQRNIIAHLSLTGNNINYLEGQPININVNFKTDVSQPLQTVLGEYKLFRKIYDNLYLSFT